MKRYVVTLEKEERDKLAGITRKGSHPSQKVLNALTLLNCDEGEFNGHRARGEAIAEVLRISARKVDRVKKRFVEEGMEAALGGRQGRHPSYVRKADGEFEARLVALSCAEPPQGHSQWSLRLLADPCRGTRPHRQCVARDGTPGCKKNAIKPWRRVGWVIPPHKTTRTSRRRWRGFWMSTGVPTMRPFRWCAWTRRPGHCSARRANRLRRRRVGQRAKTTSTDAAEAATCSWRPNPWPGGA